MHFRDAYLVEIDGKRQGVVRRDRSVWRIYLFGLPPAQQPMESYGTRAEAGAKLAALADAQR
jgi:hypothetical protein